MMTDTVDTEITPDTVASQILLERDAHAGTILVVEGDADSKFYKKLIDTGECSIIVACGKENAISATKLINMDSVEGVLCIIDADFSAIYEPTHYECNNILNTDYHDAEIYLIESPALNKLYDEYGSSKKIDQALSICKCSLKDLLYGAAQIIGAFRLWSMKSGENLTFKRLPSTEYKFISSSDLSCDLIRLIASVFNASEKRSFDSAVVKEEIYKILSKKHDRRHLCNGHDLCWTVSRSLRKLLGSADSKSVCVDNIHRILRIGYEKLHFEKTNLFKLVAAWQESSGYKIL
ncbi:hypothetical protein JCM15519_24480 [Fundidesulfovibrio butyratiphilus]